MIETNTYIKLKDKPQDNFPRRVIIHHSGASKNQTVKSIEKYHMSWRFKGKSISEFAGRSYRKIGLKVEAPWEGLGYQLVIDYNTGIVWKGRPEHYHGAHTVGHNKDSIGICLIGNFDSIYPSEIQIKSLKIELKRIVNQYNIPLSEIVPHRKFANKTCYGKKLSDSWARDLISIVTPEVSVPENKFYKKKIKEAISILESLL